MATLFNTRISDTYQGLIKTIDNTAITASLKELTDGSGNSTGIYLNNAGDFKVTAILEFGSLKDTGENIIISKFVDAADGISNNDNDTTIPTTAAIVDYVAAQITIEDLDFTGDTGSGQIDLDSQIFAIGGTTNEITTVASGQSITFSLDSTGVYLPDNSTAITQTAGDNSTKIATTSYVDTLDAASDLDITDGTNTGDVNLNTQSLSILGTTNEIDTVVSGQGVTIGLPSTINTNLIGNVTGNLTGNVTGDLTGNVTSTSVLANGVTATTQSSSDDSTKVATTAYVKGLNNASDLDFTTDSGSGAVVLNSETLSVVGTTNEIETSGTGQEIQIGLPNSISTNLVGNVTGNLTGNVVGDVTGDLTGNSAGTHTGAVIGNVTGNVTGDLTGNADTATAWQTSRDLSVTGQASATIIGVDGTSNVSAAITLDNNSVTSKVLTGLPSPAASSVLATDTIVQGIGKLQSQINGLAGGLRFMGSWDATNNNPNLVSGGGEATSGTTTSTTANKLVDSTASFTTTVTVGDKVINQVDGQNALVSNVDSDTTLSLDTDIMVSGEAYTIDNSPFITQGHYYVVNVGGTTSLNGISNWSVGDWVIAGANNEWTKLDHTQIDGTGTGDANDGNIPRFTASNIIGDSIIRETGGNLITVSGTLSTTGNLNAQGDFAINTDKFTSQASTGNTAFTGDLAINTDKFTVNATNGNVDFLGDLAINTDKFTVDSSDGAIYGTGGASIVGEIKSFYSSNFSRLLSTATSASVYGSVDGGGRFLFNANSYSDINNDYNLGLGITGQFAIQKVHIQGTGTTYMHIANDTTGSLATDGADIGFFTGQTALQIINRENDSVIISTNDLPRLTINGSGDSTFAGTVTAAQYYKSSTAYNVIGTGSSGEVILRPTAWNLSTAQSSFSTTLATIGTDATFAGNVSLGDSSQIQLGTGNDAQIDHNGSHLFIDNSVGNTYLRNTSTGDILLRNSTAGDIQFDNEFAGNILFNTSNVQRLKIDNGGSISMGDFSPSGTPAGDYRSFEIGRQGNTITGAPWKSNLYFSTNATITAGSTQFTYRYSNVPASALIQEGGELIFQNAPSGTAGNAVTFTERMRIDSSGNLLLGNGAGNPYLAFLSAGGNGGNERARIFGYADGGTYGGGLEIQTRDSANVFQNRINIDSSGNVGIGTDSPDYKLHIKETTTAAKMFINGENGGVTSSLLIGRNLRNWEIKTDTAANIYRYSLSYIGTDSPVPNIFTATASGNVGIGTDSPNEKLSVVGTIRVQSADGDTDGLNISSDANGDALINAGYSVSNLKFATADTERMRIDSSGKITSTGASEGVVKVVGSSASHRAEVMVEGAGQFTASFVAITGSAPAYGGIPAGTAGITTSSTDLVFATNSTERMRITSGGAISLANNNTAVIGRPYSSGTINNGQSVVVNLNSAGGNQAGGFLVISAVPNNVNAGGAVEIWTHIHTQGANVYSKLSGQEENSITISESAGAFTISNSSGSTVYYNVKVLNLTDFASTIAGT